MSYEANRRADDVPCIQYNGTNLTEVKKGFHLASAGRDWMQLFVLNPGTPKAIETAKESTPTLTDNGENKDKTERSAPASSSIKKERPENASDEELPAMFEQEQDAASELERDIAMIKRDMEGDRLRQYYSTNGELETEQLRAERNKC